MLEVCRGSTSTEADSQQGRPVVLGFFCNLWCWCIFRGGIFWRTIFVGLGPSWSMNLSDLKKTPRKNTINELKNLMVCWPKHPDYQIGLSQGCQVKVLRSVYVWNQHIVEILWWFSCDVFGIKDDLLSLGYLIFLTPNATSLLQVPRIHGTGSRSFRGYQVIGEPIHLRIIHLSCAIYFVCFLDISCLELHFQLFWNGWKWLNNPFAM